jgi:hypothetical protein
MDKDHKPRYYNTFTLSCSILVIRSVESIHDDIVIELYLYWSCSSALILALK